MRDQLVRAAERLFARRRVDPRGPRAPLIITKPGQSTIHAYEQHEHFVEALAERSPTATVSVILQVTYVDRRRRKESDYVDVEVLDGPFTYGGTLGKDIELDGSPRLQMPSQSELRKLAAKYGAKGARAVIRSPILAPQPGGDVSRPTRHLYGGEG